MFNHLRHVIADDVSQSVTLRRFEKGADAPCHIIVSTISLIFLGIIHGQQRQLYLFLKRIQQLIILIFPAHPTSPPPNSGGAVSIAFNAIVIVVILIVDIAIINMAITNIIIMNITIIIIFIVNTVVINTDAMITVVMNTVAIARAIK